jgi:hypothetical protein
MSMPVSIDTPLFVDGALVRIKRLDSGSTSLEGWRDGAWSSREPGTTWEAVLGSSRPAMPQELRDAGVPERYWIRTPHSA